MSEQPLGSMNAWGGRRADGGTPVSAVPDQPEGEIVGQRISLDVGALRDLTSVVAVLLSGPMLTAGAAVAYGAGQALIAFAVWLLIVGIGLGIGGDR